MPHEVAGAHRRAPDLVEALGCRLLWPQFVGHQFGVAADGEQDVVEVVRNAAGQRAQRRQLLRLQVRLFEPLAVGHVDHHRDQAPLALQFDGTDGEFHVAHVAGAVAEPHGMLVDRAGRLQFPDHSLARSAIVVDAEIEHRRTDDALARIGEEPKGRLVEIEHGAVGHARDRDADRAGLEHRREPLLALAQGLIGRLAARHVAGRSDGAHDAALFVEERRLVHVEHVVFALDRARLLEHARGALCERRVVGVAALIAERVPGGILGVRRAFALRKEQVGPADRFLGVARPQQVLRHGAVREQARPSRSLAQIMSARCRTCAAASTPGCATVPRSAAATPAHAAGH
jgi:hypothetical protein